MILLFYTFLFHEILRFGFVLIATNLCIFVTDQYISVLQNFRASNIH